MRVVSKHVGRGKAYLAKAVLTAVVAVGECHVMLDDGSVVEVSLGCHLCVPRCHLPSSRDAVKRRAGWCTHACVCVQVWPACCLCVLSAFGLISPSCLKLGGGGACDGQCHLAWLLWLARGWTGVLRFNEYVLGMQGVREGDLETVVSRKAGTRVMVVMGEHAGEYGKVLEKSKEVVMVQLAESRDVVELHLDAVADYQGSAYDDDW